jgi:hypothetical protein
MALGNSLHSNPVDGSFASCQQASGRLTAKQTDPRLNHG